MLYQRLVENALRDLETIRLKYGSDTTCVLQCAVAARESLAIALREEYIADEDQQKLIKADALAGSLLDHLRGRLDLPEPLRVVNELIEMLTTLKAK